MSVAEAHAKLSEALEDPNAGNDDVRDAAIDLCEALNAEIETAKEAPIAWVAVGTFAPRHSARWFYAFATSEEANEFVRQATEFGTGGQPLYVQVQAQEINWDVYPCQMDSVDFQVNAFLAGLKE